MTLWTPQWTQDAIIYHIYPMGFFDCPTVNPIALPNPKLAQIQPKYRLEKIRHFYQHFRELGINTIYFGPIFESCTHGYDTINYFQIDRRLGTNQLFAEIVSELKSQNIRIILDGVFNHTSRMFPAFEDIKKNQQNSKYIDWYKNIDFTKDTIWNDGFDYQKWENHTDLPELDHDNADVQKFIYKVIQYWQSEFDIDGWRLDVAYELPKNLIQSINNISKNINPQSFIVGELIHENYEQYVTEALLDSCTNYQLYNNIVESLNRQDPWQLEAELSVQEEVYRNLTLLNFTGNHDTTRLHTQFHNKDHAFKLLELIMTLPGIPCIYYGDEIGLDGEKLSRFDQDVRQSMPYPSSFTTHHHQHLSKTLDIINKYKKRA